MQIAPYAYLRNCPNFDPSRWPCCESSAPSPQSNLLVNLEAIRDDHMQYISQLARHSNEATTTTRELPRNDAENRELTELALRGLQLLSAWTQQVMELVSVGQSLLWGEGGSWSWSVSLAWSLCSECLRVFVLFGLDPAGHGRFWVGWVLSGRA